MSSRESPQVSSFCPSSDDTLTWLINLFIKGLERWEGRVSDVDADSKLGWEVWFSLFFCLSESPSQSSISEKLSLYLFCSWTSFSSLKLSGQSAVMGVVYSFGHFFSCRSTYSTVLRGHEWGSGWCFSWLGRCKGLPYGFCFLVLIMASQFPYIKPGQKPMLTFFVLESLSLLCILIGEALGLVLDWMVMAWLLSGVDWFGVTMVCFCLRYSFSFLCLFPKGLHLITWVFLSFLNVLIPHKVHSISSTWIVPSGRLHEKKPKRHLQFAAKLQAILGTISVISYVVSWGFLDAKVN